jgi:hypothetical protein
MPRPVPGPRTIFRRLGGNVQPRFEPGARDDPVAIGEQEIVFPHDAGDGDRRRGEVMNALVIEIGARHIFER